MVQAVSGRTRVACRTEDAVTYEALFERIKAAFVARYVLPDGSIRQPTTGRSAGVAATVARKIKDGRLALTVDNDSLGVDPAPNVPKRRRLKVRIGGATTVHEYPEDAQIDLGASGKDLQVVEPTYAAIPEEDAQGSYALALRFGLLDEPLRSKAIERLVAVVARDGGHPATGFWSSAELLLALSDAGRNEDASRLANLTTRPSWGHMLGVGGTTFWEAFDADQKTLSLNHWTHSACGEWLWRDVAGLKPDPERPGYRGFTVRPRPTPEVSWCKAEHRSARGPIRIEWRVEQGRFTLNLGVPPGSAAQAYIPGSAASVTEGGRPVGEVEGVRFLRMDAGVPVYEIASGFYRFAADNLGKDAYRTHTAKQD